MNKKLLLWILTFILLIGLVSSAAPSNSNVLAYYPFDVDGNDTSPSGFDFTVSGATLGTNAIIDNAYFYDGSNDYLSDGNVLNFENNDDFSVSFWINTTETTFNQLISKFDNAALRGWDIVMTPTLTFELYSSNSNRMAVSATGSINDGSYHHVVMTYDGSLSGSGVVFYIDGVNVTTSVDLDTLTSTTIGTAPFRLANRAGRAEFFNGAIDELLIYNGTLTSDEVDFFYASGLPTSDQQYPFATPVSSVNDSTESTAVVKQVGSLSFSGGGPHTIFSSDFNITYNNTPLYGAYTFQVASNGNNEMFCELLINGTVKANVTRTQYSGETAGNGYIKFPAEIVPDNGTYTQELECTRVSGTGLITISNAVGVGHFLIDQEGNNINYNSSIISSTVTSGTSYTLLDSLNITIGNRTNTSSINPRKQHIILESAFTYANNGVSSETVGIYANINGTNCTQLPRTVVSGGVGSVSYDCILPNVTANSTYQIDFYGNGTNIVYDGDVTVKNFFLSNNEIIGGSGAFAGLTFSDDVFTTLVADLPGGNNNHDVANVFNKLSYSITTNGSTTVSVYFNVSDGSEYLTNVWQRDFTAGNTGVIIGQDVFENLPKDTYNVSIYANCGTDGVTCTISGGQTGGYLTDVVTTITNSFDVTAYNNWTNSSIINFTVTDGSTVTSVNGTATYFSTNAFENLTISSVDYFNSTVLNHNTSLDLNVSLKQSDIKFDPLEIISGNPISNASFTIDGVTKGVNESFYLSEGVHTVYSSSPSYYSDSFLINVSPLDNLTYNVTFGNARVNFTANQLLDGVVVENFSIFIDGLNSSYSSSVTANGSWVVANLVQESFTFTFVKDGYINSSVNFTLSSNYTDINFVAYREAAVNFNFFDEETLLPVVDVDFNIFGRVFSGNFSTGSGSSFLIESLPEDVYEVRYMATDYTVRSYFFIIPHVEEGKVNASLYLVEDNVSNLFVRKVSEQDANPLTGFYLEVQRPYVSSDNSSFIYRSVEIASIDSVGDAVFTAIPNTQQYRFRILNAALDVVDILNQGFLVDTSSELLALAEGSTMTEFNSLNDVVYSLRFVNSSDYFVLDYTGPTSLSSVCLSVVYSLGSVRNETEVCSVDSSGTLAIGINSSVKGVFVASAVATISEPFLLDNLEVIGDPNDNKTTLRYIGGVLYLLCIILSITLGNYINAGVTVLGIVGSSLAFGVGFLGLINFSGIMLGGLLVVGLLAMIYLKN